MKNKIISFMLALCLIIPCALVFTACDKDDDIKSSGKAAIKAGSTITLDMAINLAEDGDLIKLDSNIVLTAQVNVDKKITIDMAGYTISNAEDIWDTANGEWSLISVKDDGDLTIKNGTLQAKENDCYAIDVREGGKLTIESGKYIGNVHSIYVREGEAHIKGGEFDILQLAPQTNDSRYTLNCEDESYRNNLANIIVTGGTFANYNPDASISENPVAEFLADGYTTEESEEDINGDVWYTVVAE